MRVHTIAVALCVLGAIVPCVMAGQNAAPMFSEWMHAQKAGPSTRAKIQDASQEAHTKHLCLQETQQYNCRYFGCSQIGHYASEGCPEPVPEESDCGDCTHGSFYQSDLTCCTDEDSNSYGESTGGFGSGVGSPTLKVGTCDWNVKLHQDYQQDFTRRKKQIWPPSAGFTKIGTVTATCYLTYAADMCSDLLCDKMVLSFQGGAYEAAVKSTLSQDLATAFPDQTCLKPETFIAGFLPLERRRQANATTTTTEGTAVIFSGVVTLFSMDRQVEYDTGHMDYIASFTPTGAGGDDEPPQDSDTDDNSDNRRRPRQVSVGSDSQGDGDSVASSPSSHLPIVTPNTYNIKLVSKKGYDTA